MAIPLRLRPCPSASLPFTPAEGHILRQTGARRVIMATRIGVLVPAGNPTVEPELYRMAPSSVTLHFARIDGREGTPGAPDGMEQRLLAYADALPLAVPPLAAVLPKAVVLAHTSLSYAVGFANEPTLID